MEGIMENIRWNISISPKTDRNARVFLAMRGSKKGDLSRLVEKAVENYIFDELQRDIHQDILNSGISSEELDDLIDEAVEWVRNNKSRQGR